MAAVDELSHETIYDPVKAHEYYIKTRQLKGRKLSTKQKEGQAYVKKQVSDRQKQDLKSAAEANKAAAEQLREKATARREEIRTKLKAIFERISNEGTAARDQINKEMQDKIDAVPPVPKGLSKEKTAELAAKRADDIAAIRGEAKSKLKDVGVYTKAWREGEQKDAEANRKALVDEVKKTLDKAKEDYQAARDAIKSKYEDQLNKEFAAISGGGG
jgi:hypothetical protein